MQKKLLFELISTLNPLEVAEAGRWLASPVHNQRADVQQLFMALTGAGASQPDLLNRIFLWEKMFPGSPYNDQEFRLRCSYLLRALEDWLAWKHWQEEQLYRANYALAAYRERGLERHFHKRLSLARQRLEQSPLRSPDYYLALYDFESEVYHQDSVGERQRPKNLQAQDDALTCAMISLKLKQACFALAHRQVSDTDYRIALIEEVLAWAAQLPYAEVPAVAVYREAYHTLSQPEDDAAFIRFREAMIRCFSNFPAAEMRDLLLLALNSCIRRINQGQRAFLREAFTIYNLGLESQLLLEDGWITPYTYNNIVGIAIRLEELAWADDFVQRYCQHLEPEHRNLHFALNAARLAYARNDYRAALLHLQSADYRDFFHNMMARVLQMKIYYETGENELLATHLKNTRAFLRRRRTLSYHEKNYLNILQLTEQLLRRNAFDRTTAQRLRDRILATDPLTEREWLLAQL